MTFCCIRARCSSPLSWPGTRKARIPARRSGKRGDSSSKPLWSTSWMASSMRNCNWLAICSTPTSCRTDRLASRAWIPSILGLPHSNRRAEAAGRQSLRSKSPACSTMCQPYCSSRSCSRAWGRLQKSASPSGPHIHLWPSATTKSAPAVSTSKGSAPRLWMASTQKRIPRSRQKDPTVSSRARRPLAYCTELIETSRVRSSQRASNAASGSALAGSARRSSTPCSPNACQTSRLEGNSPAKLTTLSPGRHSRPKAISESASEVFFTSAISSGEAAPTKRARRRHSRVSTSSQRG